MLLADPSLLLQVSVEGCLGSHQVSSCQSLGSPRRPVSQSPDLAGMKISFIILSLFFFGCFNSL